MADNLTTVTTVSTVPSGSVIATDDVGGAHYQRMKLVDGTDGSATAAKVTSEGNLQAITPNRTASGTLGALNEALTVSTSGAGTVVFHVTATTLNGTLVWEGSIDGTTWEPINATVGDASNGNYFLASLELPGQSERIFWIKSAGLTDVRMRVSVYTSGSVTVKVSTGGPNDLSLNRVAIYDAVAGDFARVANGTNFGALRVTVASDSTGQIKLTDGTRTASVRDTGASDSLNVAIVDAAGAQITSFGGGTQYTEADTDASITGTAMLWEDASDTLRAVSAAKPLPIGDAGGSLTVDGTVTANLAAGTNNIGDVDVLSSALPTGASTLAEQQTQTTALQLLDDTVYTDDTSTHATGTSKGNLFMAAAVPTDAAVNTNDIGALAMTTDRKLHVSVQDALPAGTNAIGKLAANSGVDIGDVDVASLPALPAGTNNIGDVDVLSLPAIPAGTNNIGDVDVLTLPADPLGANADAVVAAGATGSISAKLRRATQGLEDLKTGIVLAAGTANVGDVDVASIAAGDNNIGNVDVVSLPGSGTATLTNVADTATSTTLLAANAARLGATIWNDSTAVLYVKFGTTASATSATVKMVADAYYEVPFGYTGRIDGIWASDASGSARITELT